MNDFTKDELQTINEELEGTIHQELINKIQSMIDKYCEIITPTMADYVCNICNEEWKQCECKR